MQRIVLALTALGFAAVAAVAAYLALREPEGPVSPAQVNMGEIEIGGPFTLTDHTGRRVSSAELIDGPTLVYFGYTFCPDICPVDVATMARAAELLAERGIEVRPVFITVDPERDTPEALGYFAEAMHPRMVALTGTAEEIRAVANAYRVYYEKIELEDSAAGYLMNHTTFTYLVTPEGVQAVFRNKFPADEIAAAVEKILSRG
jgi:protein SCO1/2